MNKKIETYMTAKTTYKRLGDYIQLVDVRNKDLKVEKLLGLSIEKCFIPSIANITGTDMSTYKIVKPKQFAYGPVTSRNGDKITIALFNGVEKVIISQAYQVFEITDKEQLCPDYLMMWFRRPEFDRYARFKSHGSAREIFDWATMCDVMVPIPSIDEQRKIVSEYQALTKRIEINNQLITKLENTAQTIYRNMFVYGIDKENLPEGWRIGGLGELVNVCDGTHDSPKSCNIGYPLVTSQNLTSWYVDTNGAYNISQADFDKINERSKVDYKDILLSMIGTVGNVCYVLNNMIDFAVKNVAIFKTSQIPQIANYLLLFFKSNQMKRWIESSLSGSTQSYITLSLLREMPIVIPEGKSIKSFNKKVMCIIDEIDILNKENYNFKELQSLLLAKMGQ